MKKHISLLIMLACLTLGVQALSFGQNKVNATPQNWSVIQTMHFDIYYPKGEDEFGKVVSLMSEEIYYYIKAEFNVPILSRIPIVFYGTKTEFQTTNIIYPLLTEGVGGFTESLRNRVVVPFDGSYAALEELLAHELTHAYVNAMDSRFISNFSALRSVTFPFWFSEGLPEYLSIGGEDEYNNMFLMDMVINDRIGKLQETSGYLAYRLGESFLAYLSKTWGREKIVEYFFALRNVSNLDDATKKVFGMEFSELESRWRYQLKRDYFPMINSHGIPKEGFEQRTFHRKNGSYFNFAPRFSPDGSRYVYYSNVGARFSIWMAGTQGLAKPKKILQGESTAKLEEFYYMRSTLSWFPDNRRIAFAAKTADGDQVHIFDVEREKIVQTIELKELSAIYEADVSPDGKQLVLAAQKGMQADLYLYNLETHQLTQLTNDFYNDSHPRFSPDGKSIAFDSERHISPEEPRYGLFADFTTDVFTLDIDTQKVMQITSESFNCTSPIWCEGGKKLAFISNREGVANFEIVDLESGAKAELSKTMAGAFYGDISVNDEYLLISNYFDGAWDIYFDENPLSNLSFQDAAPAQVFTRDQRLMDKIDLTRLDYFGKRTKAIKHNVKSVRTQDPRRPALGLDNYSIADSLRIPRDFPWDNRPDSISVIPTPKPYRTKFALEYLWGGMAYSSSVGTVGNIELGLSDLMGNHGIGISLGVSGKLEQSNALLSYTYLKHRTDYGIGVYNFYDETIYRYVLPGQDEYERLREQESGVYFMARYPFSRYMRLEFDGRFYKAMQAWDYLYAPDFEDEDWTEDISKSYDTVFAPGISLVHDNSLSGSTGPLLGWRAIYHIRKSFAQKENEYLTNYLDIRSYTLFNQRYSVALRLNGGISTGKNPDKFNLSGYYGVRALDEDLVGEKKLLTSMELRFPFFDYIAMAFPIPLVLGSIRGSAFADVGAVWDDTETFRGSREGVLEKVKFGYGFGPRMNLGYFVMKLDVAWLSDLSRISKPQYYLSLTSDF